MKNIIIHLIHSDFSDTQVYNGARKESCQIEFLM